MVLSIGELEKKSIYGNLYKKFFPELLSSGEIPDDGTLEAQGLMPDTTRTLGEMVEAPRRQIFRLRRELFRPRFTRHRLVPEVSSMFRSHAALPDDRDVYENPTEETFIYMEPRAEEDQVGVAGFDLRVGKFIAWSDELFRWGNRDFVNELTLTGGDRTRYKYLEPGEEFVLRHDPKGNRFYYIVSHEGVLFSENLEVGVDSKSTTGRVGAMTHEGGFTDEGRFVTILQPHAFDLKITSGKTRLSQVVVRYRGTPYMTREEVLRCGQVGFEGEGYNLENSLGPRGLQMRFDTRSFYRALKCDEPIDMDVVGSVDWKKYFEKLEGNSEIPTDSETLYLLGSIGRITLGNVCGILSKQEGVLSGIGAYSNFAGIFQPGFSGGITMEYYSPRKQRIPRGDGAGYVLLDKVDGESKQSVMYNGSYGDNSSPMLPKMMKKD